MTIFAEPGTSAEARRAQAAWAVKTQARDITDWPDLEWFNSSPCALHATLNPLCQRCGIRLRAHQRIGTLWLFLVMRGLLSDVVGPQPLDARVLTPYGWKSMGELQAGDEVVDPEGKPSEVEAVIPQGTQDVYRITFSDGSTAESTLGHLWQVRTMTGSRLRYKTRVGRQQRDLSPWKVRTLAEIVSLKSPQAVPLITAAPDFRGCGDLPVDPYLLGLLLGDGSLSKHTPEFGSADPELLEAAEQLLPEGWGWTFAQDRTGCKWYRLNGSQPLLRELGLFGKRAWEKSVPECYKWSTAEDRLAVLQGLMDTDGNWAIGTGADFGSSSRQLAEDVAELARSLGLRTSRVRERKTSYTYRGERCEGRSCWRVAVAPAPGTELFRLGRKLKPQPRQRVHGNLDNAGKRSRWQRDQRVKWIREVEYVRTVPVQCIRVSAPSHLYVTDNWTVTHNSGKTAQVLGCLALCKENGELDLDHRAVIVCRAAAVEQWAEQIRRLLPGVMVIAASGDPQERLAKYMGGWEIAVVSDRTFAPAGKVTGKSHRDGDVAVIRQFPVHTLAYDDIDAMRNPSTKTAWAINKLAEECVRVIGVHGTPLQKRLPELWSFLRPLGGVSALGSLQRVRTRYVQQKATYFQQAAMVCPDGHLTPQPFRRCSAVNPATGEVCGRPCHKDPTGRKVLRTLLQDGGVNPDTVDEFRARIAPLVLRRTADDLDDVELPAVQFNPVHLELNPAQRRKYNDLKNGVLRRLKNGQEEVTPIEAQRVFMLGWQICSGLATIDGPAGDDSAKFDWVLDKLAGDLEGRKVICFVYFKDNVAALGKRLERAGIGHVKFWSAETDKTERFRRQVQFREDPDCQVLIGTTTIEASLDLQAAGDICMVDTILNPARFTQIVGRARRQGSAHKTVYVHHLLARNTQEDGYLPLLRREQDMADVVWDENSDILTGLTPRQLMRLVAHGTIAA